MKLMEKMRQKKLGNKGFSLVELIIVIAIMAILLGIVGTQVIPYLNRAREAKDEQVINSYSTAAVTIYSTHAEDFADAESKGATITYNVYLGTSSATASATVPATTKVDFDKEIKELVGYSAIGAVGTKGTLLDAMVSKKGQSIDAVNIEINFTSGTITAKALKGTEVLFEVESSVGTTFVAPPEGP